jgi:hypothetical protein
MNNKGESFRNKITWKRFKIISFPKLLPPFIDIVLFDFVLLHVLEQPRTQGILLPVSENGPGIGRSHDLKISSIWGVQLW